MAVGDFHRLVGSFRWNGQDHVFVAEGETKEWIVDFAKALRDVKPTLDRRVVIEAT